MKGSGLKKPSKSEEHNMLTNRVSIIAMTDIKSGTILDEKMIDIRRPGNGIQPIDYERVLGRKVIKNISKESPINWNMLE